MDKKIASGPLKTELDLNLEKKEDEKEKPKTELKKFQTDSLLTSKTVVDTDRKNRMQARLLKARQMAKKKEESLKYKQSGDIKLRASMYEGKIPGSNTEENK